MKKITDFIVDKRYFVLALVVIISIFSFFLANKVNINDDITLYLPKNSETRIGKSLMDKNFKEQKESNLLIMFKDLDDKETTLKELSNIKGVDKVNYDDTDTYNKGEYTLYELVVKDYDHSDTALSVYNTVKKDFSYEALNGSIYHQFNPVLQEWIVVVAVILALIILIIASESYVEPFLYLITMGIAIFINKGTNIIFPNVSKITNAIAAILQLALSMDYSIMLSTRFRQEKMHEENKIKAMKKALYLSFKAISSSSITTVVGLIALVFMSFTIGKDLGFVLAKGVFLSLVCIFLCLPALLLIFDKLITKFGKKTIHINLEKLGKLSFKTRFIAPVLIVIFFVTSFILKGNLTALYTGMEQDKIGKIFPSKNTLVVLYNNEYEDDFSKICKNLNEDETLDNVLCYGNTIGEDLTYDELLPKLSSLGEEVDIDSDIIKVIYYDYFNKAKNNKISLKDFVNFINNEVLTNPEYASLVNSDTKSSLNTLNNFTNPTLINKKRSIKELSNILGIKEDRLNDLIIYYYSVNDNNKALTIGEFTNFVTNDLLKDTKYQNYFDKETTLKLKQLNTFTDKELINTDLDGSKLSSLFNLNIIDTENLILLSYLNNDSKTKLTVNEFANFTLSNEFTKEKLTPELVNSLKTVSIFSDEAKVNTLMNETMMFNVLKDLGFTEQNISDLYLLGSTSKPSNSTYNLVLVINTLRSVSSDINTINKLDSVLEIINNYDNTLTASELSNIYPIDINMINAILTSNGVNSIKLKDFNNLILSSESNPDLLTLANFIKNVSENKSNSLAVKEASTILGIEEININKVYGLLDYQNNLVTLSIKDLVNLIINNNIDLGSNSNLIKLAYQIVNNPNKKYDYQELSNLLNKDNSMVLSIYQVYDYETYGKISPVKFTKSILDNLDNPLLKGKLNNDSINNLKLLDKVMDSTNKNVKYKKNELAKVLNSDKELISLIYGVNISKSVKTKLSLNELISFINESLSNNRVSSAFTKSDLDKISALSIIMDSSLKNKKLTALETYNLLSKLDDNLNKNLVTLIYTYYGSNSLDKNSKISINEFINYLDSDILNNEVYSALIDDDLRKEVKDAKAKIVEAKELLVSNKYSRIIINSTYPLEGEDTFKFISKLNDMTKDYDDIYVIGDSNMAYEMSNKFDSELTFITILTMIFIFVVVMITFRSILIPFILVLIIQCAVFITMSFMALKGNGTYFLAILIVQAILMGATIDYAIVYTSYYKELREKFDIKDAIIKAYNQSIHTILTSSSILILVTLVVANFASAIASKICETVSLGTLCSVLLIVFILPGILATFDKLIIKKKKTKK